MSVSPPERNDAALDFLKTRRSRPGKTLTTPVPDRTELEELLSIAARTPDHGKLEPWRFIVLERPALERIAALIPPLGAKHGIPEDKIAGNMLHYGSSHLAVAVISSPKISDKIPEIEQVYSAGAVCLALLNAALAAGWGANWLSGWSSHYQEFGRDAFNLTPSEKIAGIIHIGTAPHTPPDRPRPDLDQITEWMSE
ncbi:MAG: nitroreductase family protein [Pseudomonadota bacterium]